MILWEEYLIKGQILITVLVIWDVLTSTMNQLLRAVKFWWKFVLGTFHMVALAHLYGRFASHVIGSNSTKLRILEHYGWKFALSAPHTLCDVCVLPFFRPVSRRIRPAGGAHCLHGSTSDDILRRADVSRQTLPTRIETVENGLDPFIFSRQFDRQISWLKADAILLGNWCVGLVKLFRTFWLWIGQKIVQRSCWPINVQNTPNRLPIERGKQPNALMTKPTPLRRVELAAVSSGRWQSTQEADRHVAIWCSTRTACDFFLPLDKSQSATHWAWVAEILCFKASDKQSPSKPGATRVVRVCGGLNVRQL